MYEQVSHALLNRILDELSPTLSRPDLRHFLTRLGANFYAIHSLFRLLYGKRDDFEGQMTRLVEVMARNHLQRSEDLKEKDAEEKMRRGRDSNPRDDVTVRGFAVLRRRLAEPPLHNLNGERIICL